MLLTPDELTELLDSWLLRLEAENKSHKTIRSYRDGVNGYLTWCDAQGVKPDLRPDTLAGFTTSILRSGKAPATARLRQLSVRQFSAWLTEEGEITRDDLLGVKAVRLDDRKVDPLTDDEVKAMLSTCRAKNFHNVRDESILRLMFECGLRAGEVIGLDVDSVDIARGIATIERAKGGKNRIVTFGAKTKASLDRYLRMRRRHKLSGSSELWLGSRSNHFTYSALMKSFGTRATSAGVTGFHPHRLRHSFAVNWLSDGGTENGLLAVGGWSKREMIEVYVGRKSMELAAAEARRLNIGDRI